MAKSVPNVIVFGGCGFIGRNLVEYLVENNLANSVRVVDKVPPQVAWLSPTHLAVFEDSRVEFKSANLINPVSVDNAFEGGQFDYAINCACETKPGQTEPVYKEGIYRVTMNCALSSAQHGVKRFIEFSSGQMGNFQKEAMREDDPPEPWTNLAKFKLQVEQVLPSVGNLSITILRPAIVYGSGDRTGLVPRLVIGGIYRHLGESMKLLWDKSLWMNTIHVEDVCRAVWHLISLDEASDQTYNLVDDGSTTQGIITELISEIYDINTDYWGSLLSSFCRTDMEAVVDEINDKHSGPWADLCLTSGIENTPLSPYIHQELLLYKHLHLDNSKLKATGFRLIHPKLTKDSLLQLLNEYASQKLFPKELLS